MFKRYQQIHFVGIGGVGMSGIAEVLLNLGYRVTGSDARRSDAVERLERLGAKVFVGHQRDQRRGRARGRLLLRGGARQRRAAGGPPARHPGDPAGGDARRADAAQVRHRHRRHPRQDHDDVAWSARCWPRAASIPTVVVGGRVHGLGSNARLGQGEFLVAEADESDGSFLKLSPTIAVVTTIDAEHLDHYADLDAIREAFLHVREQGAVLRRGGALPRPAEHPADDPAASRSASSPTGSSPAPISSRGACAFAGMTARSRCSTAARAWASARCRFPGGTTCSTRWPPIAVGLDLEMPFDGISDGARRLRGRPAPLSGPRRRAGASLVVDDYGHHPAEIRATLAAAKAGFDRRVDHGVPAAPLHADAAPAARVPHGVLPGRRADRDGHLRGGRGADPRRPRARPGRGHRAPTATATSPYHGRRPRDASSTTCANPPGRAIWC